MIAPTLQEELRRALGAGIRFDAAADRLTSLRVGGPVDAVATPADRDELAALLGLCHRRGVPCRAIGRGFNTLIRDEGLDGVLIQLSQFRALALEGETLFAEAGVSHASLTRFCRDHGLAGLEFGAGIPGSLGGWVAMNAGIGEREVKDALRSVEWFGPAGDGPHEQRREELDFVYRALRGLPDGSVISAARLQVEISTKEAVSASVDALLARRQATQPLDVPSCGSVFKNPAGGFAGQLIEAAGLKGETEGGAMISPLHANFIVNSGHATAEDVLRLIERAREEVERQTGVSLETEVHILGRSR